MQARERVRERVWERIQKLMREWVQKQLQKSLCVPKLELEPFYDAFKCDFCETFPKGFLNLFSCNVSLYVSPKNRWVVKGTDVRELHLLQTGIQELDSCNYNYGMPEHKITHAGLFTFTRDDLYVVYLSDADSLLALCLQTGTVFTSVSGRNFFYFTRERQVGFLFRSGSEEKAIFLTNLYNPFKFFPVLCVKTKEIGNSVAVVFSSSDTVIFVAFDLMVLRLCITTDDKRGIAFKLISESPLTGYRPQELRVKNCVLSPDGKQIAFELGTKIKLHSFSESVGFPCTVFESEFGLGNVCLAFSADSTLLLFCTEDDIMGPRFYVWDVQKELRVASFKLPGWVNVECFCLSSDKRKLILCGEYEIDIWEYDKRPCRSLKRIGVERSYKSLKFNQCAVSLDNKLLVCCIGNLIFMYNFHLADAQSSKRVFRGHLGRIEFCKFLKVNRYLISYGVDGMVFLWDIIKSKPIGFARIVQEQENIGSMAVSPEEDRVICFTSSGRVCVINLFNLDCILSPELLTAPTKNKVDTAEASLQLAGQIASTSKIPTSSNTVDEDLSSSDSDDEDFSNYYNEYEELEESD